MGAVKTLCNGTDFNRGRTNPPYYAPLSLAAISRLLALPAAAAVAARHLASLARRSIISRSEPSPRLHQPATVVAF